nr:hypothetical protein [Tanacetum cinerariifolium]
MSTITDVKCVLSQKAFDVFCEKFHIPPEVHPVLPNHGDTMHKRPSGKIGLYTRFFDFANFRLPLSSFLVNILRHFHINISQLSFIGAAKNDNFFWVDDFACPARFSWYTAKNVTRDPAPVAANFNAQDYATLVAHPSPFRKFPEEFLCLVGLSRHYTLDEETYPLFLDRDGKDMDIFTFIHTSNPTKVKVVERERKDDEPRLLETTVGRTILLLPVMPDVARVNWTPMLADFLMRAVVAPRRNKEISPMVEPRRQKKRKTTAVEVGGSSHPPTKLREDHGTPSGPPIAGKSRYVIHRLLVGAVLNAEVRGDPIPTFPSVTSSVFATPECKGGDHTDSMTRPNLQTISAQQRFIISSDSSHHSGANVTEAEADSLVKSFVLSDFIISGIRTVISSDTDLQNVYVPQWSITDGSRLDIGRVCHEMVDEFAPPKFFTSICGMEHDQLFTEFNVGAAWQMSLSAEVRIHAEYNIRERRRLESIVEEKNQLLKARDENIENLKAHMLLKEAKAAKSIRLCAQELNALDVKVTDLEAAVLKVVNDKFDKLYNDFVEMTFYLEERFYPHLLITIAGRRWLLTYGMKLAIVKYLNSPEYIFALGMAICKAIEKGMQDGLAAEITHGKEGRVLTDVAAYNPSTEMDYVSALQQLQGVNFFLLAGLKYNKDASVEALINILRLEEH